MDCRTAHLFLHFHRPDAGDLAGPEVEELELHLAQCSECAALARDELRIDQHLGRAMHAVEVPAGLRNDILARLTEQRRHGRRRWHGQSSRVAVAAALLLAVGLGLYFCFAPRKRAIDLELVAYTLGASGGQSAGSVNASLERLGDRPLAPSFVNYAYLTGAPSIAELPGYKGIKVPQLVFRKERENPREPDRWAVVFILDQRRFQLDEQSLTSQYKFKFFVEEPAGCTYLVMCTGDNWDWLKVAEQVD